MPHTSGPRSGGRPRRGRTAPLAVLAVIAGLLSTPTAAAAQPAAEPAQPAAGPAQPAAEPAQPAVPAGGVGSSVVTLVTGDRIVVTTDAAGRRTTAPLPPATSAPATGGYVTVDTGADEYIVPVAALPYVGSTLDQSLFDVSRLAASGSPAASRLRVQGSGATVPALPGLRLAPVAPREAGGVLTAAGGAAFGQALARQWAADGAAWKHGSARSAAAGLFTGVDRISAPAAVTGPVLSPNFAMQTLTVHGIDRQGRPDNGDTVILVNADDPARFGVRFLRFVDGVAKASVPLGHYVLSVQFIGGDPADPLRVLTAEQYSVFRPEVTVSKQTTVTMDARRATVPVSITTPRPSVAKMTQIRFNRTLGNGDLVNFGAGTIAPDVAGRPGSTAATLFVQPNSDRVTAGDFHFSVYSRLADPAGGAAYTYDIQRPFTGLVPANLTMAITPAELATVDARYDSHVDDVVGSEVRFSQLPWESGGSRPTSLPVARPTHRTEYIEANPDIVWSQQTLPDVRHGSGLGLDRDRVYRRGQTDTQHWWGQPGQPGVRRPEYLDGQPFLMPADREGNVLNFTIFPFGDTAPEHTMPFDFGFEPGLVEQADYTLWEDGGQLATGPVLLGNQRIPVSARPADYRLRYDVARTAPWLRLSTRTTTDWTFHSSPAQGGGALPAGWLCGLTQATSCGVIPLLLPRYDLGVDAHSEAEPGSRMSVGLSFDRPAGAVAPTPRQVTLAATFDDGATWTDAVGTALGGGRFRFAYGNPATAASNGYVGLRLSATDGAGNGVTQTLLRAYGLRGAVAADPPVEPPADPPGAPDTAVHAACGPVAPDQARCFAQYRAASRQPRTAPGAAAALPDGYGPADLASAYGLAGPSRGARATVAVVDAFDNPNAEADLAIYRATYGLPPCTTANGCFRKIDARGGGTPPRPNSSWGLEISLDLDMVSAACPTCRIVLVEADDATLDSTAAAENTAAKTGAVVISNSFGTLESPLMDRYESAYRHRGVAIVASTGDRGFEPAHFPASYPDVIAVGGTSLTRDPHSHRGWTETAWSGAGSGCSAFTRKPSWQHDRHCPMRTVADVSAVADPQTGMAIYDTFDFDGWLVAGGTSASAPIIAGIAARSGNAAHLRDASGLYDRRDRGNLTDVVGGSNPGSGQDCGGDYLCTGLPGYDGPTGVGTPRGTAAFGGSWWTG
jgi:hypothetical protein